MHRNKLLALTMAALLTLGVTGCSSKEDKNNDTQKEEQKQEEQVNAQSRNIDKSKLTAEEKDLLEHAEKNGWYISVGKGPDGEVNCSLLNDKYYFANYVVSGEDELNFSKISQGQTPQDVGIIFVYNMTSAELYPEIPDGNEWKAYPNGFTEDNEEAIAFMKEHESELAEAKNIFNQSLYEIGTTNFEDIFNLINSAKKAYHGE